MSLMIEEESFTIFHPIPTAIDVHVIAWKLPEPTRSLERKLKCIGCPGIEILSERKISPNGETNESGHNSQVMGKV